MAFSFHVKEGSEGSREFYMAVDKDTADILWKLSEDMELNTPWPLVALMMENMGRIIKAHKDSKEKLRNVIMCDEKNENFLFLGDIEAMKVAGKKLEMRGLTDE